MAKRKPKISEDDFLDTLFVVGVEEFFTNVYAFDDHELLEKALFSLPSWDLETALKGAIVDEMIYGD